MNPRWMYDDDTVIALDKDHLEADFATFEAALDVDSDDEGDIDEEKAEEQVGQLKEWFRKREQDPLKGQLDFFVTFELVNCQQDCLINERDAIDQTIHWLKRKGIP